MRFRVTVLTAFLSIDIGPTTGLEPGRQDSLCDLEMTSRFTKHLPSVSPCYSVRSLELNKLVHQAQFGVLLSLSFL